MIYAIEVCFYYITCRRILAAVHCGIFTFFFFTDKKRYHKRLGSLNSLFSTNFFFSTHRIVESELF